MISKVIIGYDPKEDLAYKVCQHSLKRHTKLPIKITPLILETLKEEGLYYREHTIGENGQKIDKRDGKPFSTEFSFSRFLVPFLVQRGWTLFCDCDFLFLADIVGLSEYMDPKYAVMVVKHNHVPKESTKMDGVVQSTYPRKNWSSLILWNMDHEANKSLTINDVNEKPGSWLHGFNWLPDETIGELPLEWNWLEGYSPKCENPKAIHFTSGGPWFPDHQDIEFADEWKAELELYNKTVRRWT